MFPGVVFLCDLVNAPWAIAHPQVLGARFICRKVSEISTADMGMCRPESYRDMCLLPTSSNFEADLSKLRGRQLSAGQ